MNHPFSYRSENVTQQSLESYCLSCPGLTNRGFSTRSEVWRGEAVKSPFDGFSESYEEFCNSDSDEAFILTTNRSKVIQKNLSLTFAYFPH